MPPRQIHESVQYSRTLYVLHGPRGFRRQCRKHLFLRYGLEFFGDGRSLAAAVERNGLPDLFLAHLEAGPETVLHLLDRPAGAWLRQRPLLVASPLHDDFVTSACFDRGVFDFLWCPFSGVELRMRIERALASHGSSGWEASQEIGVDGRTLTVVRGERSSSELTATEFRILSVLLAAPTRALRRQELVNAVWQRTRVGPKTLDVHLSHLRSKLRDIDLTVQGTRPGWLELCDAGRAIAATLPLSVSQASHHPWAPKARLAKPDMRRCRPAERILEGLRSPGPRDDDSQDAAVS